MNIAHYISNWWKEALEYKERVLKDGGITKREDVVQRYYQMCKEQGMLNSIKFAWLGEAGGKFRTSGTNQFWTKAYSLVTPQAVQARRNLLTYTDEFDNAVWVKTGATITPNAANSPIGTLSSDLLLEDNSTGAHQFTFDTNYGDGVVRTRSIYLRKYNCRYVALGIALTNTSQTNTAIVDLDTNSIINIGSSFTNTSLAVLQNGWIRVSWTSIFDTSFKRRFTVALSAGTTYTETDYTGTSTLGVYIWGAQLEVGSSASAYQRVIDANSWDGVVIDATQTTSTSQPYLTGNIAPTEKWGLKNPNGGSSYMTHPTISFAANEAWSVTTVLNNNYTIIRNSRYVGSFNSSLRLISAGSDVISFQNELGTLYGSEVHSNPFLNKNTIITWVADGKNNLYLYINGINVYTFSSISSYVSFNNFLSYDSVRPFYGSISAHIIRAQALTPSQVAAEANFLRSLYPEIPSVTIGSQVWATSNCEMVATPQGNLIQNVTLNANEEKITNAADREFSSDTGFWTKDATAVIGSGVVTITNSGFVMPIRRNFGFVSNVYYKCTLAVSSLTSGNLYFRINGTNSIPLVVGVNTVYVLSGSVNALAGLYATDSCNAVVDNISIQEIGWAGSTELYDAIYAQTAGTDEQKTYAGVKAAAMWRHPSNDIALGSIYGKKYNKYALKLLAMDVAYYNTANPSAPWGYDVPTRAQLTTLSAIGGNAAKKDGVNYWNTTNGTNSSGFTALGGGYIASNGTTTNLKSSEYIGCKDADIAREIKDDDNTFNEVAITTEGVSIRLIKV